MYFKYRILNNACSLDAKLYILSVFYTPLVVKYANGKLFQKNTCVIFSAPYNPLRCHDKPAERLSLKVPKRSKRLEKQRDDGGDGRSSSERKLKINA